jgi:hypothetical protein
MVAFTHSTAIGEELAQQVIAVKAVEADVQSRGPPRRGTCALIHHKESKSASMLTPDYIWA